MTRRMGQDSARRFTHASSFEERGIRVVFEADYLFVVTLQKRGLLEHLLWLTRDPQRFSGPGPLTGR
jgi:hypothetical protein